MAEFASNAKGNAALATGIIGTAGVGLGLLNGMGGLGNLFGGNKANDGLALAAAMAMGSHPRAACSEEIPVNRYEAAMSARIAQLEGDIKLRDSNIYTDQKLLEVYKYFDGELKEVRNNLCAQAVLNQKTADSFDAVHSDIICCKNELYSAIGRERDERCCNDNAIVGYVNATFYPKMVADVTTGTTTTAQSLYNPLGCCGNGCGR